MLYPFMGASKKDPVADDRKIRGLNVAFLSSDIVCVTESKQFTIPGKFHPVVSPYP